MTCHCAHCTTGRERAEDEAKPVVEALVIALANLAQGEMITVERVVDGVSIRRALVDGRAWLDGTLAARRRFPPKLRERAL